MAGFRLEVCHPIELFDPIRMEPFAIEEHPLIVMDETISAYMKLEEDDLFEYCQRLIEQTRKYEGDFTMLWHNDAFARRANNHHPRLHLRLLKEISPSERMIARNRLCGLWCSR